VSSLKKEQTDLDDAFMPVLSIREIILLPIITKLLFILQSASDYERLSSFQYLSFAEKQNSGYAGPSG
jgi:hypothetical protein